jgi:hypothetical protein
VSIAIGGKVSFLPWSDVFLVRAHRAKCTSGLPIGSRSERQRKLFNVAPPPGVEGQVRPRSGLALHHGVTVLNSPGTLDADYRGEVQVILANFGHDPIAVERGARIAQLVLVATPQAAIREVASLDEATRGFEALEPES